MRATGFVRLTAAIQTFLLLTSLVIPALAAASNPPSLSASLADGIVSVTGADFGADEAIDLVTTDPGGAVANAGSAQTDSTGALAYSFALAAAEGTYTVSAHSSVSDASASATFDGPAATPPPPIRRRLPRRIRRRLRRRRPTRRPSRPAPDPILHYIVAFTAGSTAA